MPAFRQVLSMLLSVSVTFSVVGLEGCKKSEPARPATQAGQSQQAQQAPATTYAVPTPDQLYQLVAPIALFADNLLAQTLAGSTYPDEISAAYTWLQQNPNLKGEQLMQAVNEQPWDVSVKGLTQFPDVLNQMATNMSWTSALGDAYYNVPQSVMNAVQVMRQRAYQAGNLKTTQQQTVNIQNQAPGAAAAQSPPPTPTGEPQTVIVQPPAQTIVIQPAQPDVVYVPTYNPTMVYGAPVAVYPGYSTGAMVATSVISFGVGMAVGAAISGGGCCGWGWNSWGCGWNNNTVVYNHNTYVSRSNTFVNRNNYYNRNNINANNINRNNVNNANFNRNNPNFNNQNRVNNFDTGNRNNGSTPHFDQSLNQSQFQNNRANAGQGQRPGSGNQAGNPGQGNRQRPGNGNQGGNFGENNAQRPAGGAQGGLNQGNRGGLNQANGGAGLQNRNQASARDQGQRQAARGYGQQPARGNSSNAFSNYSPGGNARTNSARGQQSMQARPVQMSQPAAGNRSMGGGGNRPAGGREGGGRRR